MNKYFLDPNRDDISALLSLIDKLDSCVKPNKDVRLSRIRGRITGTYEDYLEDKYLPLNEQDPEEVIKYTGLWRK